LLWFFPPADTADKKYVELQKFS